MKDSKEYGLFWLYWKSLDDYIHGSEARIRYTLGNIGEWLRPLQLANPVEAAERVAEAAQGLASKELEVYDEAIRRMTIIPTAIAKSVDEVNDPDGLDRLITLGYLYTGLEKKLMGMINRLKEEGAEKWL